MFALTDGADSGTVSIETWLTPVFMYADLTRPTEDEVPTVTLKIVSVTYP